MIRRLSGRVHVGQRYPSLASSSAWSPFHSSFFYSNYETSVDRNVQINRHSYYLCHSVAIHHKEIFNTEPLLLVPIPRCFSNDVASTSNHRYHLPLGVVGAVLCYSTHTVFAVSALVDTSGESNSFTQYLH